MTLQEKIYFAVQNIPQGKVATYAQIGAACGNKGLARFVGNTLHKNPDNKKTPCHRVVNAKGQCAGSFAFGGNQAQQKKLEAEGILFNGSKVNMKEHCLTDEEVIILRETVLKFN